MKGSFETREISVGRVKVGGAQPIAVQSMTTTDTMKIDETVQQCVDLAEAGCSVIRITAPTVNDAEALKEISARFRSRGYHTPLVADIHFQPKAAMIAADYVDKVRINPGNFADRKLFKQREYTDVEYQEELARVEEKFKPLVLKLKQQNKALRIGTNHGSLSDRVMNRYGDTAEGMIQSAFEYAEVCRKNEFHNFCFSMKASNVGVMVAAYRLLADRQKEKGWNYPIHLGVTEAGDGEDARIKSAIGIGSLLAEGIGDTIRVSLTETPINEIPVGEAIVRKFGDSKSRIHRGYPELKLSNEDKPKTLPLVWLKWDDSIDYKKELYGQHVRPDVVLFDCDESFASDSQARLREIKELFNNAELKCAFLKSNQVLNSDDFLILSKDFDRFEGLKDLKRQKRIDPSQSIISAKIDSRRNELDRLLDACYETGLAFVDMSLAGILLEGIKPLEALNLSFGILQATRRRMSKTEYIACPSCGRTLFDLEETTARVRQVTSHLKGVKIAIMGCIVNGPGEMADADFGYVGGAPGKVNLYVEKDCVERNIPSAEAPDRLVELIKNHGRWVEPEAPDQQRTAG